MPLTIPLTATISLSLSLSIYINREREREKERERDEWRSTRGEMDIVVGNGHGDPRLFAFHIARIPLGKV